MIAADRFVLHPVQTHAYLQPDSPVYVHCSRRSTDRRSGMGFVQVRMVNVSERIVQAVFLCVQGLDAAKAVCFTCGGMVLADCMAPPHTVFGETHLLTIDSQPCDTLRITVERVLFADGLLWRRLPGQRLLAREEADWMACVCGMRNPPEAQTCALCGAALKRREESPVQGELFSPETPKSTPSESDFVRERPAPIVRTELPGGEDFCMYHDEEKTASRVWIVLLCVFGTMALIAAFVFLIFCLRKYT